MSESESKIQAYYAGRSVLITGASGFLGQVVVEKLVRSCPEIVKIYAVIRTKKGLPVDKRFEALLASPIFNVLRKEAPETLKKIVPLAGDLALESFGLSEEHKKIVKKEVSVIIHSAANVKFFFDLRVGSKVNVLGVQNMLNLARTLDHLSAIVHVSTAYGNVDVKQESLQIEEKVYPLTKYPVDAARFFGGLDDRTVHQITPVLVHNKLNTYSYSKCLGENVVELERGDLPICIVRPAGITATVREPIQGWLHDLNNIGVVLYSHMSGLIKKSVTNPDVAMDFIPVDYMANITLAAAWNTGENWNAKSLPTYNCCSDNRTSVTFAKLSNYVSEVSAEAPFDNLFRVPKMEFTMSRRWCDINNYLFVYLPCFARDLWGSMVTGKSPRLLQQHKNMVKHMSVIDYWRQNEPQVVNDNMKSLYEKMCTVDKKLFHFSANDVDWREHTHNMFRGIRRHILKCDYSSIETAKQNLTRLQRRQTFVRSTGLVVTVAMSYWLLRRKFSVKSDNKGDAE